MDTARVAILSCGCVCAWVVQAAQAAADGDGSEADPLIVAEIAAPAPADDAPEEAAALDQDGRAAVPAPAGLRVQFDSGTMENVHRIVGFWPSVHWLNSRNAGTSMAALGYTWRNLRLEGALFRERGSEQYRDSEFLRMDSARKRLGYRFGPHWALQLSRGFLATPDQFRQDQKTRRRTASLTYRGGFNSNPWHATVAFGRGKGLSGINSSAYLLDTAMNIGQQHTVFARLERAGHDELFRNEDGPRDRVHDASKVSVGYLYDVTKNGPAKLGIGGTVSRRAVSDELLSYYGDKPISYEVFLRLQMNFK